MAQGDLNVGPDDEDQDDYSQLQEAGSSQLEIAVAYEQFRHDTGAAERVSDEHCPDRANCTTTPHIMARHWLELMHVKRSSGSFTEQHQRIRSSTKSWYGWSFS